MRKTDKYKHMNHHHELTKEQAVVNISGCKFVADKSLIPLLKALNNAGIRTRSHNYDAITGEHFICLCLDEGMNVNITSAQEVNSTRDDMCKIQVVIGWKAEVK